MRGVVVSILVVLAAALVWLLDPTGGPPGEPAPSAAGTPQDQLAPLPPPATSTRDDTTNSGTQPKRGVVTAPGTVASRPTIEVTVVERATGVPASAARGFWFTDAVVARSRADGIEIPRDWEARGQLLGQPVRANLAGVIRLPRPARSGSLVVRKGPLYGEFLYAAHTALPYRLDLVEDCTLRVQVVAHDDTPLAGVEVEFHLDTDPTPRRSLIGETDANGIVERRHLRQQLTSLESIYSRLSHIAVGVSLPGFEAAAVPIDRDALPDQPIRIELTACGGIAVELSDAAGKPAHKNSRLRIETLPRGDQSGGWRWVDRRLTPNDGGHMLVTPVALGRRFRVSGFLDGVGLEPQTITGPTRPGQVVELELLPPDGTPLLIVEIVDQAGQPLPPTTLRYLLTLTDREVAQHTSSTVQGQLRILLPPGLVGQFAAQLAVDRTSRAERSTQHGRAPLGFVLEAGENRAGVLRLGAAPVIAAGRLLDQDGNGVRTPLSVEQDNGGVWQRSRLLSCQVDEGGGFQVLGTPPRAPLRLVASSLEHVAPSPLPFSPGARDLEIVLVEGGSINVRVLLDAGVDQRRLQLELQPNAPLETSRVKVRRPHRESPGSATVAWPNLLPGSYDVRLRLLGDPEHFISITDIAVHGGRTTEDPRLGAIDLRGLVRTLTVRVTADGELIANRPGAVFLLDPDPAHIVEGFRLRSGVVKLLLHRQQVDLLISVDGYRTELVAGVAKDLEVPLHPRLRARIVIEGRRPDDRIDLVLTQADLDARTYAVRSHDLPMTSRGVLPWSVSRPASAAADGSFLVEVAQPGRYDVVASRRVGGLGSQVLALTPATITLGAARGDQAFSLHLDENRRP